MKQEYFMIELGTIHTEIYITKLLIKSIESMNVHKRPPDIMVLPTGYIPR